MPQRRTKRSVPRRNNQTTALLKELVELNKQQVQFGLPAVPDVDKILLKREKVHTFSILWPTQVLTTNTATATTASYSYTLNAISGSAAYTALFDQYRLMQVVVEFYLDNGYSTSYPIYTVVDYDDASLLGSSGAAQEYGTCQVFQTGSGGYFERVFNPRMTNAAYSGAFTSFSLGSRKTWVDVASPSVQYYGLKIYIEPTPAAATTIRVITRTIWQFKNNR